MTAPSASALAALAASRVTSHPDLQSRTNAGPALPLGWTQIQRRRRESTSTTLSQPQEMECISSMCCDDLNCRRRSVEFRNNPAVTPSDSNNNDNHSDNNNKTRVIAGTAVICLTDPDGDWFQGYLFVSDRDPIPSMYFGLLGIVQEIDECLQCAEGGYRELILQVTEMGPGRSKPHRSGKKWEFQRIAWTGGDMMRLESLPVEPKNQPMMPTVSMESDRVDTGMPATQLIQELFGSLLRRLREASEDDVNVTSSSVSDLMPNAAVVTGRMKLSIPQHNNNNQPQQEYSTV